MCNGLPKSILVLYNEEEKTPNSRISLEESTLTSRQKEYNEIMDTYLPGAVGGR